MEIKRGEVYFADLGDNNKGSEQSGTRPVLIIQNNIGNKFSPTVVVACITSKLFKNSIPTHVRLVGAEYGLPEDCLVLCEQIKTIDKTRLKGDIVARLTFHDEQKVNVAVRLSLGLGI
jgi:mRNA interferase MazF